MSLNTDKLILNNKLFLGLVSALIIFCIPWCDPAYCAEKKSEQVKLKISVTAEAFNMDAKSREALSKKAEGYIFSSLLNHIEAALAGSTPDIELSVNLKMASAFSSDENLNLWSMSAAAVRVMPSGPESHESPLLFHELKGFQFSELKKRCEEISLSLGWHCSKILKERKILNERLAELKKREEEEYQRTLKKREAENSAREIAAWKAKKYQQWKGNSSMSILDEDLERAGITFEELLKEFKQMDKNEK